MSLASVVSLFPSLLTMMLPTRFSFFGGRGSNEAENSIGGCDNRSIPSLKVLTDKQVYRPGDPIFVTIEICNPDSAETAPSLLVERLGFEIKGIEKLDSQWFATKKPLPGSGQRSGEHVFLDCSTPSLVAHQIVSYGAARTYVVRSVLPSIIPPSFKGTTIRYLYYIKSTLRGRWLALDNGHSSKDLTKDNYELEARVPFQIWVTQKGNGLLNEEVPSGGIVPVATAQTDIYWKEMDGDSEWAKANDLYDGLDDGYDSSRDEILSVSSYNPSKESLHKVFGSSLSLQSSTVKSSNRDALNHGQGRASFSSNMGPPRFSVAEVLHDSPTDVRSPSKSLLDLSPREQFGFSKMPVANDTGVISTPQLGTAEPMASESFVRGRSYNIRMDDRVLLRFSPRNSDSTYYFSDMIGGTLTFFHEGVRRCLEVSITLETSETIDQHFVHPSRRNSPTITKVQSDHHEVVADMVQTSFLFSIPMDGPMSFSTPRVSLQWALRFEFFTTPRNIDLTRYEHPLLIEGRDKSEWVLPLTVHAPPVGTQAAHSRKERAFSLEPLWIQT